MFVRQTKLCEHDKDSQAKWVANFLTRKRWCNNTRQNAKSNRSITGRWRLIRSNKDLVTHLNLLFVFYDAKQWGRTNKRMKVKKKCKWKFYSWDSHEICAHGKEISQYHTGLRVLHWLFGCRKVIAIQILSRSFFFIPPLTAQFWWIAEEYELPYTNRIQFDALDGGNMQSKTDTNTHTNTQSIRYAHVG